MSVHTYYIEYSGRFFKHINHLTTHCCWVRTRGLQTHSSQLDLTGCDDVERVVWFLVEWRTARVGRLVGIVNRKGLISEEAMELLNCDQR